MYGGGRTILSQLMGALDFRNSFQIFQERFHANDISLQFASVSDS